VVLPRPAALPVEGAANWVLLPFQAHALDFRARDPMLLAGERAQFQRMATSGEPPALEAPLLAWLARSA